jgi:FkbM family methyltransferase
MQFQIVEYMIKTPYLQPIIKSFKSFVHAIGFDIVFYDIYHSQDKLLQTIIREYKIKTVLDVGANIGQYGKELMQHGYKGEIHSFEPITSAYKQLCKNAKQFSAWKVHNIGLGSKEEEVMINVSENIVSSSILKVGHASLSAEAKSKPTHQEKVKLTDLDTFLATMLVQKEILLKLDVQGFEMEALRGAMKSLRHVKIIQIELSFTELYEGGPLHDEVTEFLKEQGYEIFSIIPGFRDERSGRMLQADGIFIRK